MKVIHSRQRAKGIALPVLPEAGLPLGERLLILPASNPVESFHACLKRKLRSRLGVHSLANGCYLIAREAERHDLPRHNRRIAGYDEITGEGMPSLGMGR